MKKIILAAAMVCVAAFANAATVGWTNSGLSSYAGDKYLMFIDGKNGASISAVTALLSEGKSADALSIGGGVVATAGSANVAATASGVTVEAGTYTAFMVLFDAATPVVGTTKYSILSGAKGYTQSPSATAASVTFIGGNASAMISSWEVYGAPEPTTGVLMLLGFAGLALRRRRA